MSERSPFPAAPSAPALSGGEPAAPARRAPTDGGQRYRLGNVLGQGGMGEVRVAEDRVLGRDVAVKVLAPRLGASELAIRRLENEARVTAALDHPGIVAVHDAGTLPDGRPYYAMRLVRGRSLGDAIGAARSDADRARLLRHLLAACEALASAHRAGVVHRDVKPDNILIGSFGETQVVDWGLARRAADLGDGAISLDDPGDGATTRPGAVLGTPWWMSPEQARGEVADARSDVWALGAILRAILTGEPPYGRGDPDGVLDALRRGPPPPIAPVASPELVAIATRALAWRAGDRYPDAGALAEDLERWFDGERVAAYAYTTADLARRLIAAWRWPLAVGAVASVVLAAVIAIGVVNTRAERDRALAAEADARASEREANAAFAAAMVERAVGLVEQGARADAEQAAAAALRRVDSPEARGVFASFGVSARPRLLARRAASPCAWQVAVGASRVCGGVDRLRWYDGDRLRWDRPIAASTGAASAAWVVAVDPDGAYLIDAASGEVTQAWATPYGRWASVGDRYAIASEVPRVWLVDLTTGAADVRERCEGLLATGVAYADTWRLFCRDGRVVGPEGTVATGLAGPTEVSAPAALPSGEVVVGSIRGRLTVLDAAGAVVRSHQSPLALIRAIRVAPDGRTVVILDASGDVGVWDTATGDWRATLPDRHATGVRFDGERLIVTSPAGEDVWALPSATLPHRVWQEAGLGTAQLSPDGARLAFGGGGGEVTVVDVATGATTHRFTRVEGVAKAVAFSPDGARVAMTGQRGVLLAVEDLVTGAPVDLGAPIGLSGPAFLRRLVWSADGLCGPTFGASIRCFFPERTLPTPAQPTDLALGDGDEAVWATDDGAVVDGLPPGRAWAKVPGLVAVDRHHDRLAVAIDDAVILLDGAGRELRRLAAVGAGLRDVAISPDGHRIAAGGLDRRVYVWRDDGTRLGVLPGHTDRVVQVEWDRGGERLVSASWDGSARLWDTTALEAPAVDLIAAVERDWGAW